jgi:phosphatidylserine/phosphatidylglycerophosphate/cardiolipin synthase-like enzyme
MPALSRQLVLLAAVSSATACAGDDVCERAAQHWRDCTGEEIEAGACDDSSGALLLATSCDELAGRARGSNCEEWLGSAYCEADAELYAANGCLSPDGERCPELTGEELSALLDRVGDSQETPGNQVEWLFEPAQARARWLAAIDGARQSIHLLGFKLRTDSDFGRELLARLLAARQRGVEVRLLIDAVGQDGIFDQFAWERLNRWAGEVRDLVDRIGSGSGQSAFLDDDHRRELERVTGPLVSRTRDASFAGLRQLAAAGAELLVFNDLGLWRDVGQPWGHGNRNHAKLLVVDGATAITGGRNAGAIWLGDRDTDLLCQGPAVADLQRVFLRFWDQVAEVEVRHGCPQRDAWHGHCPAAGVSLAEDPRFFPRLAPAGEVSIRVVFSDPAAQAPRASAGFRTQLALLGAARSSLRIANAYVLPPARLRDALLGARRRGVETSLVTNSQSSGDEKIVFDGGQYRTYTELVPAGVAVCEWSGQGTMHAKTMLVDDRIAVVGSYNFDSRSARHDIELLLVLSGGGAPTRLAGAFTGDLQHCTTLDAAAVDAIRRGLWRGWLAERLRPLL